MPVLLLRDAKICVVKTNADINEDGDYENFTKELGKFVPCRAQRQTGGFVKAKWSEREDGENTSYTLKVFLDRLPEGMTEGVTARVVWRDGSFEELRVRGIKKAQLSTQLWLSL